LVYGIWFLEFGSWILGFPQMTHWLFKEEPDHYNFADLERDGTTLWDGVTNAQARLNLRKVKRGERILYYHTGKEKAVVGEMKAIDNPTQDPHDPDPKSVVVKVEPVRRWSRPVTLKEIKNDPELAQWDLVRNSRLSVMAVTENQWRRIEEMSRT
jgi:predicted RNA-binding protein with PUA-like domain